MVDNHRISVTMEESVINAIEYAKEGLSAAEIKERLEKKHTMQQFYHGGRP